MKNIIILLFIASLLFSCKKKEPATETPSAPVTQSQQFDGFFKVTATSGANSTISIGSIFSPNINLQTTPTATYNYMYCINGGTVYLNDIRLKYSGFGYYDSTHTTKCRTLRKFQLISNGNLPNFNISLTDSVPTFPQNYYSLLGDTINQSKSFVIPLGVFTDADEIECYIYQWGTYQPIIKKTVKKGTTNITLTSTEISVFPNNALLNCQITLRKFNDQAIGGKNFRFSTDIYAWFDLKVQP